MVGRRKGIVGRLGTLAAAGAAWMLLGLAAGHAGAQEEGAGKELYDRWCAGCHGVDGAGEGPAAAWMLPRPRDFTTALYQIRTTPSGSLPTDEDILRVIDEGMPGTTMPGWSGILSRQEQVAVMEYIKSFSRFFGQGAPPEPMEFGSPPTLNDEALATGREVYERVECYRCHGDAGRGDGRSAPTLEDDMGRPIRAKDLTENWRFNGGGTVEDIYRRMRTGLDGTPMPSQSDLLQAGVVTEEELWNLAQYVRSLSPEEEPRVRDVIRAEMVEPGTLPGLTDEAWDEVDRFYVPLAGQIVLKPRWFDPRVSGVWVQALHDGTELALRVRWTDPSQSPDPDWAEWQARVLEAMEPTDDQPVEPGSRPDRLAVQFPAELAEGREMPYFLMGDSRRPTYLWGWTSTEGGTELNARGMGTETPQEESRQQLETEAAWEDGRWTVLFRRSLATDDESGELQLVTGSPMPITFFAWDGDHGEGGNRGAIGTWFFLYLMQETPVTVYVAPTVALLLTAALGLLVVARAQKRQREGGWEEEEIT